MYYAYSMHIQHIYTQLELRELLSLILQRQHTLTKNKLKQTQEVINNKITPGPNSQLDSHQFSSSTTHTANQDTHKLNTN